MTEQGGSDGAGRCHHTLGIPDCALAFRFSCVFNGPVGVDDSVLAAGLDTAIVELLGIQPGVDPSTVQQLLVRPPLLYFSLIHHEDDAGGHYG